MYKKLNRRTFIQGSGSLLVGLPLLEEIVGEKAYGQLIEKQNYITTFFGLGIASDFVQPNLPYPFDPLSQFANDGKLTVFKGVNFPAGLEGGGGNHEPLASHVGIGMRRINDDNAGGPSLDGFLMQQLNPNTPVDIIAAGHSGRLGDPIEYKRSWRAARQAVDPLLDPQLLFQNVFGKLEDADNQLLVVDALLPQYKHLMSERSGLGKGSKEQITQSFDALMQIQKQLTNQSDQLVNYRQWYADLNKSAWPQPVPAQAVDNGGLAFPMGDRWWVLRTMAEIMVLGIKLGQFRFGSFFVSAAAERSSWGQYANFGDLHEFYHANNNERMMYYVNQYIQDITYLIRRLDEEQLLANTTVMISSEMERHHIGNNMTFAVAGGPFTHQGFVQTSQTDIDIYNTIAKGILKKSGMTVNQGAIFGDPTGYTGDITGMF